MNLFIINKDPVLAAQEQCDKHVVKMIVESAQMLSTVHRMLDGKETRRPSTSGKTMAKYFELPDERENILYRACHFNHPCTIWTRESIHNYRWHYLHFAALCDEYTYRYSKIHSTDTKLRKALDELSRSEFDKILQLQEAEVLIDILCELLSGCHYSESVNSMILDVDDLISLKIIQSYSIGSDENVEKISMEKVVCLVEECNARGIKRKCNDEVGMRIQGKVKMEEHLINNNSLNRSKNVAKNFDIEELLSLEPLRKKQKIIETVEFGANAGCGSFKG